MIIHHVTTEQVAVSSSAVTLTEATVKTARSVDGSYRVKYADIQVQDAQVYVTFDGSTTPSSSAGEIWNPGDIKRVWGIHNLLKLQFIRVSGDAVLEVNYWGDK